MTLEHFVDTAMNITGIFLLVGVAVVLIAGGTAGFMAAWVYYSNCVCP